MAVDITNAEPPFSANFNIENRETVSVQQSIRSQNKPVESKESSPKSSNQDSLDINGNSNNNKLRNTISAANTALTAESGLNQIRSGLEQLKNITNHITKNELEETNLKQVQKEFNTISNEINKVSQNTVVNGEPLFNKLNEGGINFPTGNQPNDKITISFNNTKEQIEGFNTQNLTVQEQQINNQQEAEQISQNLEKAIKFVDEKIEDVNKTNQQVNNSLASLVSQDVKPNPDEFRLKTDIQAKEEVQTIGAIILGNSSEASASQANSSYENYLNLLRVNQLVGQQQEEA